jgi:hypothetical protein
MMKRLLMTAAVFALLTTAASAGEREFTAAEIAKLPQDKVALIKQQCAHWGNKGNFDMQLYCEDEQYVALIKVLMRDAPKGDKL